MNKTLLILSIELFISDSEYPQNSNARKKILLNVNDE